MIRTKGPVQFLQNSPFSYDSRCRLSILRRVFSAIVILPRRGEFLAGVQTLESFLVHHFLAILNLSRLHMCLHIVHLLVSPRNCVFRVSSNSRASLIPHRTYFHHFGGRGCGAAGSWCWLVLNECARDDRGGIHVFMGYLRPFLCCIVRHICVTKIVLSAY